MDEEERKIEIERIKRFIEVNADIISREYWTFKELNELKKIIYEEDPIVYTWGETKTCQMTDIEIAKTFLYHLEFSLSRYPTKKNKTERDAFSFAIAESFELKSKMGLLLRFITCRIAFPFVEDDEKGIFRRILQLILEPLSRYDEDQDYAWYLLDTLNHTIRTEKHEQEINDIRDSLLQELKERESELEQANTMITYLEMRDSKRFNGDRWMTVIQFYDYVSKEEDMLNGEIDSITYLQNRTKIALEARRSPILQKGNRSGNYYRIEDIVEAAASLNFINKWKKNTIILELKYGEYSKTKTDLELDGFKMITGQEEDNEARAKQGKTGNLLSTHSTPIRTMIETKAGENETTEGNE